jgi:hypothetical protein
MMPLRTLAHRACQGNDDWRHRESTSSCNFFRGRAVQFSSTRLRAVCVAVAAAQVITFVGASASSPGQNSCASKAASVAVQMHHVRAIGFIESVRCALVSF